MQPEDMERYPDRDVDYLLLQQPTQPIEEPRLRSYNDQLLHKAAIEAMAPLILANPEWNSTAIAVRAVELAHALVKELSALQIAAPTEDL